MVEVVVVVVFLNFVINYDLEELQTFRRTLLRQWVVICHKGQYLVGHLLLHATLYPYMAIFCLLFVAENSLTSNFLNNFSRILSEQNLRNKKESPEKVNKDVSAQHNFSM